MGLFSKKKENIVEVVASGNKELLLQKLQTTGDIESKDLNGWTPLLLAINKNDKEMVEILLNNGAQTDYVDNPAGVPLVLACANGNKEIVKLLLDHNASTECADMNNLFPITAAALNGHLEIVKLLVENGVDITMAFEDSLTALEAAKQNNHQEVVAYLEQISNQGKNEIGKINNKKKSTDDLLRTLGFKYNKKELTYLIIFAIVCALFILIGHLVIVD